MMERKQRSDARTLTAPWIGHAAADSGSESFVLIKAGTRVRPRYLRSENVWVIDLDGVRYTASERPRCSPAVRESTHAVASGTSGYGNPQIKARLAPDVHARFCAIAMERGTKPATLAAEWLTAFVRNHDAKKTTRRKR